jgi:polygalacturonase
VSTRETRSKDSTLPAAEGGLRPSLHERVERPPGWTNATAAPASEANVNLAPSGDAMNVRACGAVGDGVTSDTTALQAAMDRCAAAGGGTVLVPAGEFRCGTLRLRDGVRLHLARGAIVRALPEPTLFPVIGPTKNLPGEIRALLWAEDVTGFSIDGPGVIDGNGAEALAGAQAARERFRPATAFFRGCRDVRIEQVTLRHASFWTLHLLRCRDVVVRDVTIRNNRGRINTDGIDPDGCRNVLIERCDITAGDDCIVLKSTEGDDCEDVTVRDCRLSTTCAAMKVGTESIGAIRRVRFERCDVVNSFIAAALYMKDGGAYEDISFTDIVADTYGAFPVIVDITPRTPAGVTGGRIRDVRFERLDVRGPGRLYLEGEAGNPLRNVALRQVKWTLTRACDLAAVKPAGAARVVLDSARPVHSAQPYLFIAAHVDGLEVSDLVVTQSPAVQERSLGLLYLHDVTGHLNDGVADAAPDRVAGILRSA